MKQIFISRWLSRKLLVLVIGTAMACTKIISEWVWFAIAAIYIGGNVADAVIDAIKNRGQSKGDL